MNHTAVDMAHHRTAGMLPKSLLWPHDCTRACNRMVPVLRGPHVADELTRNLREPFKSAIRSEF